MEVEKWIKNAWKLGRLIYAKRLSLNDTGGTRSHQAGFYISKRVAFTISPRLETFAEQNPREKFACIVNGERKINEVSLIYYNSRHTSLNSQGRDECRITGWGGSKWGSAFGPDATGAIMVCTIDMESHLIDVRVATNQHEDELLDAAVGMIAPKEEFVLNLSGVSRSQTGYEAENQRWRSIPSEWRTTMPTGAVLAQYVLKEVLPLSQESIDSLLVRRVRAEYELFQLLETGIYADRAKNGFGNLEDFFQLAKSLMNSRVSRAGRSLELAVKLAFDESGVEYAWQPELDEGPRPDFVFPDIPSYSSGVHNPSHLAVKRTLKERWRGVLEEAKMVRHKNLLTLDTNLSPSQLLEISNAGIRLVVPSQLHRDLPMEVLSSTDTVIGLGEFIAERIRLQ